MFRDLRDFQINVVLSQVPFAGTIYSVATDRPAYESTAITVTGFLAQMAGRRIAHAYLGSAGGLMPHQHYLGIAKESASSLKAALGKQPPRGGALSALSLAPIIVEMMNTSAKQLGFRSQQSQMM